MEESNPKLHVVIVASPGLGHLIPALEISKQLTTRCGLRATVFYLVSTGQGQSSPSIGSLIESAKSNSNDLDVFELPPPHDLSSIPPGASALSRRCAAIRLSMPALKSVVFSLQVPPVALISDHLAAETLEVAKELGIPKYVYAPFSAWKLALFLSMPGSDKEVAGREEFFQAMNLQSSDEYDDFARVGACMAMADGFLVNTWEGLESQTLAAVRRGVGLWGKLSNKANVYDVGPIVRRPTGSRDHELFQWLEKQPVGSVVFMSFGGSGTLLSEEIIISEIALGLEMSKQRFIWILRPNYSNYLPDGFLERTREVGLVVSRWPPQAEILGHPSVGGFLSHCGWNSTLEAITSGLPVIAWPLCANQMMNACLLVEELGMAVRPKVWSSMAVICREEIADMVRRVILDEEIKKRAKELRDSAEKALQEGGTSSHAFSRFVDEICEKTENLPWFQNKYDLLYAMVHFL